MLGPGESAPLRQWEELDGSVNDVKRMAGLLPRFGFTDIDTTLTDERALRQAILDKLRAVFLTEARDGDVLLFYYSGHGSTMRNSLSATKSDHMDETIVPWDANAGYFDIRDKELARIFNDAMRAHNVTITAIFDSCHSGTMVRAEGHPFHPKTEPEDLRDARDPYGKGPGEVPPEDHGALILTATRFDQTATEAYDDRSSPPDEIDGAYSIALFRALEKATTVTPAIEIEQNIALNLRDVAASQAAAGYTLKQDPAMAGTADRLHRGLFGDAAQ